MLIKASQPCAETHPDETSRRRHHDTNQLLRKEVHASFQVRWLWTHSYSTDIIVSPASLVAGGTAGHSGR